MEDKKDNKTIDIPQIREAILRSIEKHSRSSNMQSGSVLHGALDSLGHNRSRELEQVYLTIFHDLFRTGHLAWGLDFNNAQPPFFHTTDQGRKALKNLTRDPANPDGYLSHLSEVATLNDVAQSYISEALRTYGADCYKATAVMIGAASESMILEVRDTLVSRLRESKSSLPKDLDNRNLKNVIDALYKQFQAHKHQMSNSLAESVELYWSAFTGQIRRARNDAGHPTSIDPVTQEIVHASLLIFPELATMVSQLKIWIQKDYS